MKNPWIIIGAIVVVLFGSMILYSKNSAETSNEGIEITQHIRGDENAKVILVEYSDLECPACAGFQEVLSELKKQFGDDLSIEFKHFPLPMHRHSMDAALAAEAAGQQGKFFEYHDLLFANQQTWSSAAVPSVNFVKYAEQLELDVDTFKRHSKSSVLRDHINSQLNEGRELGVNATPTFFLNGEKMVFNTFPEFVEQIAIAINPVAASSATSTGASQNPDSDVRFGI